MMRKNKKIFIPLLRDYYLFDYFKNLLPCLIQRGFNVCLYTFDDAVVKKYDSYNIIKGNRVLRFLNNRSGKFVFRVMLWIVGWIWARYISKHYDFAIVPWDNKPLWYIISRRVDTMTISNVTTFIDIELKLKEYGLFDIKNVTFINRIFFFFDKLFFKAKYAPQCNGTLLRIDSKWYFDKIFGYKSINAIQGFSGIKYLAVLGEKVADNYKKCGVGSLPVLKNTQIVITGSPSYENLFSIKTNFSEQGKCNFKNSLDIIDEEKVFSLFLSPSSFTKVQLEEIVLVVNTIKEVFPKSWVIMKYHPKTKLLSKNMLQAKLAGFGNKIMFISDFTGDEFNAKLVLSSDCLLQKQSTVGYIAFIYKVPVISYNLRVTDYEDDMYKFLDGSWHCETEEALLKAVKQLDNRVELTKLFKRQKVTCRKFCQEVVSPCIKIADVIEENFR